MQVKLSRHCCCCVNPAGPAVDCEALAWTPTRGSQIEVGKEKDEDMAQGLRWPAELVRQDDGSVLVSFPDVPEALTEGETEAEALTLAQDCLIAALGGYVDHRRAVPWPSATQGRVAIALPVLVAAKIALYDAMRAKGVSNIALAERLGLSESAVRRLVDLDHRSHIGQVETALQALGQQLMLATQAA